MKEEIIEPEGCAGLHEIAGQIAGVQRERGQNGLDKSALRYRLRANHLDTARISPVNQPTTRLKEIPQPDTRTHEIVARAPHCAFDIDLAIQQEVGQDDLRCR